MSATSVRELHVCADLLPEANNYAKRRGIAAEIRVVGVGPCDANSAGGSAGTATQLATAAGANFAGADPADVMELLPSWCPFRRRPGPPQSVNTGPGELPPHGGCLSALAPQSMLELLTREGAYVASRGWLDSWPQRLAVLRSDDPPARRPVLGPGVRSLCLLDTAPETESAADAERTLQQLHQCAEVLGVVAQRIPVGMDSFTAFADRRFAADLSPVPEPGPSTDINSDYAMALDLLSQLNQAQSESEIIQQQLQIFAMLFAPGHLRAIHFGSGPGPRPPVVETTTGFSVALSHEGECLAVIEIGDFAAPEYAPAYRNLIEAIIPVCSLSLVNARNFERIVKGLELRQRMVSIISHDVRGPLGAMSALLKLVAEDLNGRVDSRSLEVLTESVHAADRVSTLLNNLLDWAKAQNDGGQQPAVACNLRTAVAEAIEPIQSQARVKRVALHNESPDNMTARVNAAALKTILRNVLSNAIKFSQPDSEVRVTVERQDDHVAIAVIDRGVGMSATAVRDATDFASRHTTTGTGGERGAGLGLALCSDLLESMGGRMAVDSTLGHGTTVSIVIPNT